MKAFKRLYNKWVDETEEIEDIKELKKHANFKEIRNLFKEIAEDKEQITGYLIRELSDDEYRCVHATILLRVLGRKNVVALDYRDDIDMAADFWINWYEDKILAEDFDILRGQQNV